MNCDKYSSQPFNPYIIVKKKNQKVLYFTQAFSQVSGFHSSVSPNLIPFPEDESIVCINSNPIGKRNPYFEVFQWNGNSSRSSQNNWKRKWSELLIHELRTSTLSLDLGNYLVTDSYPITPRLAHQLVKSSHRQKVSTLVASDFIQLISSPPIITHTSLLNIFMRSFTYLPASLIHFNIFAVPPMNRQMDKIIWGNEHFLVNFLSTLIYWIPYQVTVELQILDGFSVQLNINIPSEYYLSSLNGFLLFSNYLKYVAAFFNGRAWITQSTISLIFPLVFTSENMQGEVRNQKSMSIIENFS